MEITTGPLGQGVATSVGMAMAGRWLGATYNRPGYDLFDFNVYALCGDGDLMEGVACEAASLAGHLRLSNLCWIYDRNRITLADPIEVTFTEDVANRFLSYPQWRRLMEYFPAQTDSLCSSLHRCDMISYQVWPTLGSSISTLSAILG